MHIKSLHPNGSVTKAALVDLGTNPDVRDFMVCVMFKDGTVRAGWSDGMSHGELSYMSATIAEEIRLRLFATLDDIDDDPTPELD